MLEGLVLFIVMTITDFFCSIVCISVSNLISPPKRK